MLGESGQWKHEPRGLRFPSALAPILPSGDALLIKTHLRERVRRVRDEQARLSDGAIADDDAFNILHHTLRWREAKQRRT